MNGTQLLVGLASLTLLAQPNWPESVSQGTPARGCLVGGVSLPTSGDGWDEGDE